MKNIHFDKFKNPAVLQFHIAYIKLATVGHVRRLDERHKPPVILPRNFQLVYVRRNEKIS